MSIIEEAFDSNKLFWRKENYREQSDGMLLYENLGFMPQMLYPISKVALCLAKSLNLEPAVIMPWRGSKLSESMCQKQFQIMHYLPIILIRHFFAFVFVLFFMDKKKLLAYKKHGNKIGTYMYDAILRKYCRKTVTKLTFKDRIFICYLLSFYYYYRRLITKYPVKVVVLEDEVYLLGLMYELCKNHNIVCYSPISLNTYFLKKHESKDDFKSNYLTREILERLCDDVDYKLEVKNYFSNRYSGHIEQHDVLSAYSGKIVSTNEEFAKKYRIDPSKKTVIIMSHVFADAPHVYTDALYDDYWDWFTNSYNCLVNNPEINLLVKEHPSAYLYGEKGVITDFLTKKGMNHIQIKEDESTLSILQNVDVVVTCGGTIGIEISYVGKNVVLASKPPYSGLGFTRDFNDRQCYENYLRNGIQCVSSLSEEQRNIAEKAAYVMFCRADNWTKELELGGEKIYMGREYDDSQIYSNMLKYNETELEQQNVYKVIKNFVNSDYKQLYSGI